MKGLLCAVGAFALSGALLGAQATDAESAAEGLSAVEALLGWEAPRGTIDLRIRARSPLGLAPLPVVRLTGEDETDIIATVSEWGVPPPDSTPGRGVFKFLRPPPTCLDDGSLCVGTPMTVRSTQVKAMWFALILARNCTHGQRAPLSDAEDLYVRGIDRGHEVAFFCSSPRRTALTPADRQAAAVLHMMHTLLGRFPVRERRR